MRLQRRTVGARLPARGWSAACRSNALQEFPKGHFRRCPAERLPQPVPGDCGLCHRTFRRHCMVALNEDGTRPTTPRLTPISAAPHRGSARGRGPPCCGERLPEPLLAWAAGAARVSEPSPSERAVTPVFDGLCGRGHVGDAAMNMGEGDACCALTHSSPLHCRRSPLPAKGRLRPSSTGYAGEGAATMSARAASALRAAFRLPSRLADLRPAAGGTYDQLFGFNSQCGARTFPYMQRSKAVFRTSGSRAVH
jgi:hypothetical protein